jgi:amino acid adenylation domain-containing protein
LAETLLNSGVRRGDRIAFCLPKSIESIASIFGILKASAAYVPLDPLSPAKRLSVILQDCQIQHLISSEGLQKKLSSATAELGLHHIVVSEKAGFQNLSTSKLRPQNGHSDDLAYILYTSGSTGAPKGVMISHRASLAFVTWAGEQFGIGEADRLSSHAPFHFDLSIFDIFSAVQAAATLVLIPEELSVFPAELADFLEEQKISVWYSVPSALIRLLTYGRLDQRPLGRLRTILFAGEVFPVKHLRKLTSSLPEVECFNLYGPTETNVCTFHPVRSLPKGSGQLPIGKPCSFAETWALTASGQPIRKGQVGELYVAGDSLMDGYWGRPRATEEVLVTQLPSDGSEKRKTYRTGDLVTLNASGDYVFRGRMDDMVKSRGYRIELGEIEATLHRHEKIREAAVIAVPDVQLGSILHAVVVMLPETSLTESRLRRHCSEFLPSYMIPATVHFAADLPRTPNGKVDKKKLVKALAS